MLERLQIGAAQSGQTERRLVERVLRHWKKVAAGRRFPGLIDIDPWMVGDDWANCLTIAVQSPVELSHFVAVGDVSGVRVIRTHAHARHVRTQFA